MGKHHLTQMSNAIPSPFAWDASFDVSHNDMGDQHKGLFAAIDAACKNPGDGGKLDALKGKVAAHFAAEEALVGGGLGAGHKAAHDDFLAQAGSLSCPLGADKQQFVKQWLVDHIKDSDIPSYKGKV